MSLGEAIAGAHTAFDMESLSSFASEESVDVSPAWSARCRLVSFSWVFLFFSSFSLSLPPPSLTSLPLQGCHHANHALRTGSVPVLAGAAPGGSLGACFPPSFLPPSLPAPLSSMMSAVPCVLSGNL